MYHLYHNKEVQIFPQFVPWKVLKQLLHCWLQTADISIIFHRYFLALLSFLQTAFAVSIFFQFSFLLQRETTSSIRAFHTSVIFSRIFSSCSSACLLPQQLTAFWGSRDMMGLDFEMSASKSCENFTKRFNQKHCCFYLESYSF